MPDEYKIQFEQYKILHESVQNSHKLSWTITSIFFPIAIGSMAFLVKHSRDLDIWQYTIGTVSIEVMLLFWVRTIKFLENSNKVRFHLLKKIEKQISFEYYGVLHDHQKRGQIVPHWIRYKNLIRGFAVVLGLLVAASLIHNVVTQGGG